MISQQDLDTLAERAGVSQDFLAMYAPLLRLLGVMLEEGRREVHHVEPAASGLAIEPTRLYTSREAAALLGLSTRRDTMSEIPEHDLPRCRVGPARGSVRYLGADLLAYAKGLPVPDLQDLIDDARETLHRRLSRPAPVHSITSDPKGRRRVL